MRIEEGPLSLSFAAAQPGIRLPAIQTFFLISIGVGGRYFRSVLGCTGQDSSLEERERETLVVFSSIQSSQ